MKIQIGSWTIRSASSLKKIILASKIQGIQSLKLYWQCVGIYDTRILGIVFYRNDNVSEFEIWSEQYENIRITNNTP